MNQPKTPQTQVPSSRSIWREAAGPGFAVAVNESFARFIMQTSKSATSPLGECNR